MKRLILMTVLGLAVAIAGCTSATNSSSTIESTDGMGAAVNDLEESIVTLQTEAEAANLTEDLTAAWTSFEDQLQGAMQSVASLDFADVNADALRTEAATFTDAIAEAGDELSEEFRDAWDALRINLETVLNSISG